MASTTNERLVHRGSRAAGVGAIAFGVLTVAQLTLANPPGGSYEESAVAEFLTKGHRLVVIALFHLALLGVLGLVVFVAELRRLAVQSGAEQAGGVISTLGGAAAASFALGWAVHCGLVLAHVEGGDQVVMSPTITYTLSQIGVTFVFGSGAILFGLALLAFAIAAKDAVSPRMRLAIATAGVAGIAGLAFFTFFLQMLLVIGIGLALLLRAREADVARSGDPEGLPRGLASAQG
jgi:hypothetical protein